MKRPTFLAVALFLPALLAACGSDSRPAASPSHSSAAASGPGPVHVHGLGVNPADGSLYIATHTGLFRAAPGASSAVRVGTSEQDTMGFSVEGRNRFIGSGHPGPGESKPPLLGLITSRDGGRSWTSRSLLGKADFHILRAAGKVIYGFDASNGRLLRSPDAGGTWAEREIPGTLIDLVPNPSKPDQVVASTQTGLVVSNDGARKWRRLARMDPGLLAWPTHGQPFHIDGAGNVSAGADGGKRWERRGRIPGTPAALAAASETELYAALGDGTVLESRDGGASWRIRSRP